MITGYWIDPDGKIYEVIEHLAFVRQDPKLFGLTRKQVAGLMSPEKRVKILIEAMKREWIRVRGHRDFTTYEFWGWTEWTLTRIRVHLDQMGAWDNDIVVINDLEKKKGFETTAGYIRSERALLETNPKREKQPWRIRDLRYYFKFKREKFF